MIADITICLLANDSPLNGEQRLALAAAAYSGLPAASFKAQRQPGGKPWFPDHPQLHFSISHSGCYWAAALGRQPLGLDLQQHQSCDIPRLSRRFLHPEERDWLEARGFSAADFFPLWAAKESYLKFTGQGLAAGLDNFSVLSPPPGVELRPVALAPNYSLCLCARRIGGVGLLPLD